MDSGIYIICFYLEKGRKITVGRLGKFSFNPGFYFYVGSAQRNLSARLERHSRKGKPLHWHIDYLAIYANAIGALLIAGNKHKECRIADELSHIFQPAISGFGSSDCSCDTHLYYLEDLSQI
jgi:sugar fermentation stimulation protein A